MGKMQRTKGADFEREVVKVLRPFFPDAKRNLDQYQEKDGRDISEAMPLCIQCKRRKRIKLHEIMTGWIEARESSSVDYPYPMVTWRNDNTKPESDIMCAMKLEHLIEWMCGIEDGDF